MRPGTTTDVRVCPSIKTLAGPPKKYVVRYTVAGKETSRVFDRLKLAQDRQRELIALVARRVPFDVESKEPVTEAGATTGATFLEMAREMLEKDWHDLEVRSNQSLVEELAIAVQGFVPAAMEKRMPNRSTAGAALRAYLNPTESTEDLPAAQADALRWHQAHSLRVDVMTTRDVERALRLAKRKLTSAGNIATTSYNRRRQVLSKVLTYCRAEGLLTDSGVQALPTPSRVERQSAKAIDPAEVTTTTAARRLVDLVAWVPYRTVFMLMLYAGVRPEEAKGLRRMDVELRAPGERSRLMLRRAISEVKGKYATDGVRQVVKPLKHRKEGQIRIVPIPSVLAEYLRPLLADLGPDDLVAATRDGEPLSLSALATAFRTARALWMETEEDTPSQMTLPVPYYLRHTAATTWLRVMPVTEVAGRLGHAVGVCQDTYLHSIASMSEHFSQAVDDLLGE